MESAKEVLMSEKLFTKASVEKKDGGFIAVASTAVEDRHGEVVSVDGWDLKNFKKTPVMLWAHDHQEPAIGVAKNMKIDGVGKKARLIFEPVFHEFTDKARALKNMVEEGIINSFSVGFRPLEVDGTTYVKQELLEVSLVNVPANPEARILTAKSVVSEAVQQKVESWVEAEKQEEVQEAIPETQEELSVIKAELQEIREKYADLEKGLKHLNPLVDRKQAITTRLTVAKAIARASDKMLADKPKGKDAVLLKVIKRSSDSLINDSKQELKLSGKN